MNEMAISFKEQMGYNHHIPLKYGGYTTVYAYQIFYRFIDTKKWAYKVRERRREGRGPDKIYLNSFGWNLLRKVLEMKKEGYNSNYIDNEIQEMINKEFPEFIEKIEHTKHSYYSTHNTSIPILSQSEHQIVTIIDGIKKIQAELEILISCLESNVSKNETKKEEIINEK